MKFGVREICDVVFKAKNDGVLGSYSYVVGQPVLYIDTAKTSTIEGAATTVYATGGRGNTRLIAWEGEKTLTFTVEDALLSPVGFAILSGAGLLKADSTHTVHVHATSIAIQDTTGKIDLADALGGDQIEAKSPVFVMEMESGSIGAMIDKLKVAEGGKSLELADGGKVPTKQRQVFVDYYVAKTSAVTELTIDAENFAGYYYVEASTLFRRQEDGVDMPAEIVFPNVKIQSNFTFSMASTGDPSTFTFTMDAMPGYTRFDLKKPVLCAIQIVDEGAKNQIAGKDSVDNVAELDELYPLG